MTSSNRLILNELLQGDSSRKRAIEVRKQLLTLLEKHSNIELDLQEANFTPSVADEIIGELAKMLGATEFKQKIKILNATEAHKALMKHVIARKLEPSRKAS